MPNLRRVELVFPVWSLTCEFGYTFTETVKALGIRVCSKKPSRKLAISFMKALNRLVQNAAGRLTIQFLDEGTMNGILLHEVHLKGHAKEGDILKRWLDHKGHEYNL
jgi:hypothetical protein